MPRAMPGVKPEAKRAKLRAKQAMPGAKRAMPRAKPEAKWAKLRAKQAMPGAKRAMPGAKRYCRPKTPPCWKRATRRPFLVKNCWQPRVIRVARAISEGDLNGFWTGDCWK